MTDIIEEVPEENKEEDLRTTLENAFKEAEEKSSDAPDIEDTKAVIEDDPVIEEKPKIGVPQSWNKELSDDWSKLPENIQKYVTDREAEVHKGFTKFDEERVFGKQLKETISPYMAFINAEGSDPVTAVKNLLNTAHILRTADPVSKAQMFSQLAQQHGVDLSSLTQPTYVDPTIRDLQAKIDRLEGGFKQSAMATEQEQERSLQSQITDFAVGKQHFETLKPMMASLLSSGNAQDLQSAYEMAMFAHPTVRQSALAERDSLAATKQQEDAKAKAAAAKAASVSISGNPGVNSSVELPAGSLREELTRQFRNLNVV
jgi:hypothetical protein